PDSSGRTLDAGLARRVGATRVDPRYHRTSGIEEATMRLDGSCHCGAVKFSLESHTPQPFMRCYCSICRKTAGGGGYAINIMGESSTLKVTGAKNVAVYRARIKDKRTKKATLSKARRNFCAKCASALW